MELVIDIETIPDQRPGALEALQKDARENFRAPASLTKEAAAADLGIEDTKEVKFTSKDALLAQWEERFREDKADEVAEQAWRKTALDGSAGQVVVIGVAKDDDDPTYFFHEDYANQERLVLQTFFSCISEWAKENNMRRPCLIGHNLTGFDLRFLYQRAIINDVRTPIWWPHNARPWDTEAVFDTMVQWAGVGGRIKLDSLCKTLGIPGKPDDIDGSKVWDFVRDGKLLRVAEYCIDDVQKTRAVFRRLSFRGTKAA